jgi:site-specific recombinase XerD
MTRHNQRSSRGNGRKNRATTLPHQAERWIEAHANRGNPKSSGKTLRSDRTVQRYTGDLSRAAKAIQHQFSVSRIRDITTDQAQWYISQRIQDGIGTRTIQGYAKALQTLPQVNSLHVPSRLHDERDKPKQSRAYTRAQFEDIKQFLNPQAQLSAQIMIESGVRDNDLASLRLAEEKPATRARLDKLHADRFLGRENWVRVTVVGKGGHEYETTIRRETAKKLEQYRLTKPRDFNDRKLPHAMTQYYDIPAGQKISRLWSDASNRALGYSHGAHGLRHTYAQERVEELLRQGMTWSQALERTSQTMGHYRPEEVKTYLR